MIRRHHPCRILAALVAFMPIGVAAQTAGSKRRAGWRHKPSPIARSLLARRRPSRWLTEIFSQQIAVTSEARAKAEARAAELGTQLGFTQGAVISFFRIVGEQDVPPEQIGVKLGEIAVKHRALMERWSVLDTAEPATAALAAQAKAAIDAGRYDEADAVLLRAATRRLPPPVRRAAGARAQQAAERRWLRAAEADGKRGDLAMTRLRYGDAAQHLCGCGRQRSGGPSGRASQYLEQEAAALYHQGTSAATTELRHWLSIGIGHWRATDRATMPLDWARTQTNLGKALKALGEREPGTERLEEAVAAYRLALEETDARAGAARLGDDADEPRQRASEAWGARGGTARLEEAVAAYRLALQERTRERVPLDWAMTQMNLGIALSRLGEREAGTARLEEAVAAYRLALQEMDARAGAARLGDDADEPRQRASDAWGARSGDGTSGGGGGGLPAGAGGDDARAGAARLGD